MTIPFGRPDAVAKVSGNCSAPCLCGTVKFYQMGKNTLVVADICGLPKSETGFFAMHIHQGGDCLENFQNTQGHYNPDGRPHPLHAGDLPSLLSCGGRAYLAVLTNRFRVREVVGRTLVIHANADDFRTQPAGNAGEKIACGVISER